MKDLEYRVKGVLVSEEEAKEIVERSTARKRNETI